MEGNFNQISLLIITTTGIIFLLAAVTIILIYQYQKKQIANERNVMTLKLDYEKNLLKTQMEIQEQTFQNISREIHDNISLTLTLAKLNLNTVKWDNIQNAALSVTSSVNLLGEAISDLSSLSKSINTELIRNLGLLKAIKNEVEKLEQIAHLKIKYEIKGEPIFMDCEKELIIFRIIQEAFNNIIKHSNATTVRLELNYLPHCLDITIKDNGVGFIREKVWTREAETAGLNNMQNRAKLCGGNVVVETEPENGTQVLVTVPY